MLRLHIFWERREYGKTQPYASSSMLELFRFDVAQFWSVQHWCTFQSCHPEPLGCSRFLQVNLRWCPVQALCPSVYSTTAWAPSLQQCVHSSVLLNDFLQAVNRECFNSEYKAWSCFDFSFPVLSLSSYREQSLHANLFSLNHVQVIDLFPTVCSWLILLAVQIFVSSELTISPTVYLFDLRFVFRLLC
jgi:hypothetical protein